MSSLIKTDDLCVGYDKKVIVENVSIDIKPGQIMTLIGPNGCGKSTVLKTILKQLAPVFGTVYVENRNYGEVKSSDFSKMISMVMTKRPKTELMTCRDVVATGRYPYTGRFGVLNSHDEEVVMSAMKYIGAEELSEYDFDHISDGQKQRIMIARAIAQEPKILILDEPTSFLDIRYKFDILSTIKRLAQEKNIGVIMSLHELELARGISDTIVAIENGRIGRIGSVKDIYTGGYLPKLYNIDEKYFDEERGTLIMPQWES